MFFVKTIGHRSSPRVALEDDDWGDVTSQIILDAWLSAEALLGLQDFSHAEMCATPDRPCQDEGPRQGAAREQPNDQCTDSGTESGTRDSFPSVCLRSVARRVPAGQRERESQHGQCDVAMPAMPVPDLTMIEADFALAALEAFLDGPAPTGDPDQLGERRLGRGEDDVIGAVRRILWAASDQQPVLAGRPLQSTEANPRPVIKARPLWRPHRRYAWPNARPAGPAPDRPPFPAPSQGVDRR